MEVNDYVRLPDGIHKIKKYEYRPEYENCHCMYLDDNDYGLLFTDKELIKHSPNIIDLIEVGDIIKGIGNMIFSVIDIDYENKIISGIDFWCEEKDIKSIVTKEQFESMEYKVKE